MKRLFALLKVGLQKVRNYISPAFVAIFVISFSLWYISKLNYNYTTDLNFKVKVNGERIVVPCVVDGKGSNLIGYGFYISRRVSIPLSELNYDIVEVPVKNEEGVDSLNSEMKVRISPISMQDALSIRFSNLKIVSVGDFNDIDIPKE